MTAPIPAVELLECAVSPEWAAAVAGASTAHLEAALAPPDLWKEMQVLERLMYKNANQHRGSQHYQRLQEVRRLLALLRGMQLGARAAAFHSALQAARQRGALPTGSILMAYGGDQRRVPSHSAAAALLHALRAACHLVEQLGAAVHRASLQLLAQLAHSFFMPLCLTSLAALARIQVLTGQLLLNAVQAYNGLAEAAALLPTAAPAAAAAGAADRAQASVRQPWPAPLPQMLRAQWKGGLPLLEAVACPPGGSLAEQAAAACARYGLQLVSPGPGGPAAAGRGGASGPQLASMQPVLAVVEDRGVAISREAFAAAVAAAPAVAEAGSEGDGDADEAAAEEQSHAGAPKLLGLVEDNQPEEDSSGVVASLMEGEARGHLYRRATAALGQRLGKPRQVQHAQRGVLAQQGRQAAVPPVEAAPRPTAAPAAADPVPAAPAAAARPSARLAIKPAFLSVAVQPVAKPAVPKPAFLSVAEPAPTAAGAATVAQSQVLAAAAAPALPPDLAGPPAAAADAIVASPAALALDSVRKRKKPAAVAAAEAAAAAQHAAAAALPKSWEDWLTPVGGAGPAGGGATAAGQQAQQGGKRRRR